ncbi:MULTISPECIES: hypothetical protein [Paenibacillus]|uniref:hypothetical protein n=1 Tax=Paenibacillus TaxID=44249 RepID=UPI00096EAC17|nr:hypothetical protein [Paenibacillus odorifer]OMD17289.1 hypothetical protein BJP50_16200 [Paenibacillus odorifer]
MVTIKDFSATMDLPYYMPCLYPPIHEQLKILHIPSKLSLLMNLRLSALPCVYVSNHDRSQVNKTVLWASDVLGYYDEYSYLGVKVNIQESSSFESGLELINETLNQGNVFIASGTTYYLPYSTDYLSESYKESLNHPILGARNHFLGVYGLENDYVYIYDPKPWKFMDKIKIEDFGRFWKGDSYVEHLDKDLTQSLLVMGQASIDKLREPMNESEINELFLKLLKTLSVEFLQGEVIDNSYYFGKSFYKKIFERIQNAMETGMDKKTFELFYYRFLFEMKFGKYFFKDLLLEHSEILESIDLNIIDYLLETIRMLELSLNTLLIKMTRKNANLSVSLNEFALKLSEIESRDNKLFNEINTKLSQVTVLKKKQQSNNT